jgi:hypothetical protein
VSVTLCEPGLVLINDSLNFYSCVPCPSGTFLSYSNADFAVCDLCTSGKYSPEGSTTCSLCPPGSISNSNGSAFCSLCPPGTYLHQEAYSSCLSCATGRYSSDYGSTKCQFCIDGSITANEAAQSEFDCICSFGEYGQPWNQKPCKSCILGAGSVCSLNTSTPYVHSGYWRDGSANELVYRCFPSDACSETGFDLQTLCSAGYTGDHCGMCDAAIAYRQDMYCKLCGDNQVTLGGVFTLSIIVALIVVARIMRARKLNKAEVTVVVNALQLIAMYPRLMSSWPSKLQVLMDGMGIVVSRVGLSICTHLI